MNRVRFTTWIGSLGVAGGLLLSACGGESETKSSDDGSGGTAGTGGTGGTGGVDGVCEDITPCGGDPTGTWSVRENCAEALLTVPELQEFPGCEDIVGAGSAVIEGTFTLADGVMTQDFVMTASAGITIDDACARGIWGSDDITAEDLCPLLTLQFMGTCEVTSEGCSCDAMRPPMPMTNAVNYTVVGNQLVIEGSDPFDFCQQGDELHLDGTIIEADTGAPVDLTLLLDRI